MRKIVLSMMITLDGFFEGPNKELDWHNWNPEMDEHMIRFFGRADTLLFGRKTYQLMESFWPTSAAEDENPGIRRVMNELPKIVFSKSLDKADWSDTTVLHDADEPTVAGLKAKEGKDILLFGGAEIANHLLSIGMIDEFRIIVNPRTIGDGTPLFKTGSQSRKFDLISSEPFRCGNVSLTYVPSS